MKHTILFAALLSLFLFSQCGMAQSKKPEAATYPVTHTDADWKVMLTPAQYHILREQGTERAYSGKYDHFYDEGTYYSAASLQPVFSSDTKFNSGTGSAQLLRAHQQRCGEAGQRQCFWHDALGSGGQQDRIAPRACVRRWAGTHRQTVLHEQ